MNIRRHFSELIQDILCFRRLTGKGETASQRGQGLSDVRLQLTSFLKFGQGSWEVALFLIGPAELVMGDPERGVQVDRGAELAYGLIVAAREIQSLAEQEIGFGRERVELAGTLAFGDAFVEAHHRG